MEASVSIGTPSVPVSRGGPDFVSCLGVRKIGFGKPEIPGF